MIDFPGGGVFIVAKTFLMVEKIILNIHHSDDYTDYLFQTVCIKNKRIIPLMNVSDAELKYAEWPTTLILNCDGETCDNYRKSLSVWVSVYCLPFFPKERKVPPVDLVQVVIGK